MINSSYRVETKSVARQDEHLVIILSFVPVSKHRVLSCFTFFRLQVFKKPQLCKIIREVTI